MLSSQAPWMGSRRRRNPSPGPSPAVTLKHRKSEKPMFNLKPIGFVRSSLVERAQAPKQGNEGSPEAWLEFKPEFQDGLVDLRPGDEILVLTWLDRSNRETLSVHPRD